MNPCSARGGERGHGGYGAESQNFAMYSIMRAAQTTGDASM
jgi:hypothetical protein